jgi:starch-binding outer membrane protein, SusD/RagB family
MMNRLKPMLVAVAALAVTATGCQDLEIANPNNPDRDRALRNPGDVETLIASAWYPYWNRTQVQGTVYHPMNAVSSVMSTSVADNGGLFLSEIPRPVYDNNPSSDVSGLARFPWYDFYSGLDSANEGLRAIDGGLEIGSGGADNPRAIAWAKFSQGLNLGMLGMMFDRAIVATEDTDLEDPTALEFQPYTEVIRAAVDAMEEAAQIALANEFTIPATWLRLTGTFDNQRLARLARSFAARFLVLSARSPAEREALPWNEIYGHIDAGIQDDVWVDHSVDDLGSSNYKRRIQANFFNGFFFSHFFLAFTDVSGNSQIWLNQPIQSRVRMHITSPDARIQQGDSMSNGKYTIYRASNSFRDERGTWRQSYNQLYRWSGGWRNEPLLIMSVDEMELYRAEGYARTGQGALAADIVNRTRVDHGELPPVTASGVPQSADCVPRDYQGNCMDIVGAVFYERMLETTGFEAPRDWMEMRGWGYLYPGTFVQLPVPGRELETLNLPLYTFGGGGDGSAP